MKTAKLLAALKFASKKHASQRRKGPGDVPYINHPIEVAEILSRVASVEDAEILMAALLHDTVEDTDTTEAEIASLFGDHVAALVMECSDDKSLPKHERKNLQVEHAPHKTPGAKLIKIADKISNINDIANSPPVDWSVQRCREYLDWSERVVAGLRGENPSLDEYYDASLRAARTAFNRDA
jgi:guanosine-3',5'-bis(diphosphate) 3'-pyrophosphohydrolase